MPRIPENGKLFDFRSAYNDSPQVLENIPPVRITFPDGTNIMSDFGDIDHSLSKTFDREVRLMKPVVGKIYI